MMMIVAVDGVPTGAKYTPRRPGEHVEAETMNMSHQQVDKKKRQRQVLEVLGDNAMTAKEVAVRMYDRGLAYSPDRHNAAPRLTELRDMGLVEVVGKKRCTYSGKTVSVYRRVDQ